MGEKEIDTDQAVEVDAAEARDVIELGKKLGISFGNHESDILNRVMRLEVMEEEKAFSSSGQSRDVC